MNKFLDLTVSGIANLNPYIPGKPIQELQREYHVTHVVKLASNESPYGPSPLVVQKLTECINNPAELARYPDGSGYYLKEKIVRHQNVIAKQITLGNGSNDILENITQCFAGPGDEVIFSQYAFAIYPLSTQAVGATAVITEADNWGHNLDAMIQACNDKTKLIFIANPNNPTGTCLSASDIYQFLKQVPDHIIVVIDEAYMEYSSHNSSPWSKIYQSARQWLNEFDNLIVTRTFSKAYGLAGLRIGYSLSCVDIAEILNRVRQPFNNNSLALEAATIALHDQNYVHRIAERNNLQMKFIENELDKLGINYIPSAGNFVCVDVSNLDKLSNTIDIYDELLHKGIITRSLANYNMSDYLRITIGKKHENQNLISFFESILQ